MRPALQTAEAPEGERAVFLSAQHKTNIDTLKESIAALSAPEDKRPIVGDLLQRGDLAILVTPIDPPLPKAGSFCLSSKRSGCSGQRRRRCSSKRDRAVSMLSCLAQTPRIVITDSQAFAPSGRHCAGRHPTDVLFNSLCPAQG